MVVLDILWAAFGPFICYFGGWVIGAVVAVAIIWVMSKIRQ